MHRRYFGIGPLCLGFLLQLGVSNSYLHAQSEAAPAPAAETASPSATEPTVAVPESKLFRETGPLLSPLTNSMTLPATGLGGDMTGGDEFSGRASLSGLRMNAALPFSLNRSNLDNAQLKLGPLYFSCDELSASLLYVHFHPRSIGPKYEWYSILNTHVTVIADIGERFSLALDGDIYYLPFQHTFGITTVMGLPEAGGLLTAALFPTFRAQAAYTTPVDTWPVTFADDLSVIRGRYADSAITTFDDFGGRNTWQSNGSSSYTYARPNGSSNQSSVAQDGFGILSNRASISTEKSVPGDWLVSSWLSREDLWYFPKQPNLPTGREEFNLSIVSQRENFRFKPYATYDAMHWDGHGVDQVLRIGAFGPITDLLFARASVGAFFSDQQDTVLGLLQFDHTAGPSTTESLYLSRDVGTLNNAVIDSASYHIVQILGPQLRGDAYGLYARVSSTRDTVSDTEERAGVRLTYSPSPKTTVSVDDYYSHITEPSDRRNVFASLLTVTYRWTDSLNFSLLYTFLDSHAAGSQRTSYTENIGFLQIRKYFQ